MQLAASNTDQFQNYRPTCTKCGAPTMLARIAPSGEPGYDNRTFECPACGNIDSAVLKF
ncbi:MAG: hypothetical protein WCE79_27485 [Xanthobacteraceae bacterium]